MKIKINFKKKCVRRCQSWFCEFIILIYTNFLRKLYFLIERKSTSKGKFIEIKEFLIEIHTLAHKIGIILEDSTWVCVFLLLWIVTQVFCLSLCVRNGKWCLISTEIVHQKVFLVSPGFFYFLFHCCCFDVEMNKKKFS